MSDDPITVQVGVYENPPKVFTDDDGEIRGLFPDVLQSIASQEGWELVYVKGNWTQCLQRLSDGEIDVMVDVAISDVRSESYSFSNESMLMSWGIVYERPGEGIESIPELEGKTMAVMKDSIHTIGEEGILSLIDKFQVNVTVIEMENYTEVFESIDRGEVDVGVVNRVFGGIYGDDYDVSPTPIIFNPTDLRFAFPLNSSLTPYLIERIDDNLIQLKLDPDSVYYQSLREYLPSLFEEKHEVPGWLVPLLLGSFMVLIVIGAMNMLLRHEVKARTKELESAYDDLVREKNRSDLYLDLMSHDIANIDQGIYGLAELSNRLSHDDPELREYSVGILRLIQRAVNLIESVRLLSRLKKERRHFEPMNLNQIVEDCVGDVVKLHGNENAQIDITAPDEETTIIADRYVKNLFTNLIDNAIRYQRRSPQRVVIEIRPEPEDATVSVIISDHGPGITAEMKSILLQRFDLKADAKLTGMGLALVNELVERYNGRIEILDRVEGDWTQGAKFVVTLPVND